MGFKRGFLYAVCALMYEGCGHMYDVLKHLSADLVQQLWPTIRIAS